MKQYHPYHMVQSSPWPFISAMSSFFTALGLVKMFHLNEMFLLTISMLIIIFTMIFWWRDMTRESTFQGWHSKKVIKTMKLGMIMFITSEILFFFSFFWAFFHSSFSPNIEMGLMWPPKNIMSFNPFNIPLLGTTVLLTSGITITWAHHSLMKNNLNKSIISMTYTIILGVLFTLLQSKEYYEASFNISDSIYSSTFFVATGFHGLHVLIGTTFLTICLWRMKYKHFSHLHHIGFETASWYWHFVDVVWLFLFVSIYWWGN